MVEMHFSSSNVEYPYSKKNTTEKSAKELKYKTNCQRMVEMHFSSSIVK